jgi:rod shape-determining protein MreB and related proteins
MGLFARLTGFRLCDMAVDLGTTSTALYVPGRGIVLSEPSLIAVDSRNGKIRAVGIEARRLVDRGSGSIIAVRPLRGGVIADFEFTEEMLRRFIRKVYGSRRAHPRRVVVGVPSGATGVEKRAVEEACLSAGVRHADLIEEPIAAAIGAGLPVGDAVGSLVVDIGGGTSEAAVISLGGIVVSQSIRVGGDELDQAIVKHLRSEHKLLVTQQTAEEVKREIGSAFPLPDEFHAEVCGRDARSGMPRTLTLTNADIREALEKPVKRIIESVKETIVRTPPDLGSDIIDRGVILAGGGALLRGLEERLRQETEIPAHVAELPITCVAAGSGRWLEELEAHGGSSKKSPNGRGYEIWT